MVCRPSRIGFLMILGLTCGACEQRSEVARDMEDLKKAQADAPNVARDLEQRLKDAKAEVVELEKKTELAQHGITDEVLKQRDELKGALKHEEQNVSKEVKEAEGAARSHNAEAERAIQQLDETRAPRVEANVETETRTEAQPTEQIRPEQEDKQITIRRARVTEERGAKSSPEEGTTPPPK